MKATANINQALSHYLQFKETLNCLRPAMSYHTIRFETRDAINAAIAKLVEQGVMLDDIDVELSKIGAVDLDLCLECLNAIVAKTSEHRLAA